MTKIKNHYNNQTTTTLKTGIAVEYAYGNEYHEVNKWAVVEVHDGLGVNDAPRAVIQHLKNPALKFSVKPKDLKKSPPLPKIN